MSSIKSRQLWFEEDVIFLYISEIDLFVGVRACIRLIYTINHCSIRTGITCDGPENGTNTMDVPTGSLDYLQSYTYSCKKGYKTDDQLYTFCQPNGMLSLAGREPNCSSK